MRRDPRDMSRALFSLRFPGFLVLSILLFLSPEQRREFRSYHPHRQNRPVPLVQLPEERCQFRSYRLYRQDRLVQLIKQLRLLLQRSLFRLFHGYP